MLLRSASLYEEGNFEIMFSQVKFRPGTKQFVNLLRTSKNDFLQELLLKSCEILPRILPSRLAKNFGKISEHLT